MSTITQPEGQRTWLLEMPGSSYAITSSRESGLPRHLHWGRPIGQETASAIAAALPLRQNVEHVAWAEEDRLECVGWGGRRYDEPTIKVDFADGTRGIEWHLADQETTRDGDATTLVLDLQDRAYPLRVELSTGSLTTPTSSSVGLASSSQSTAARSWCAGPTRPTGGSPSGPVGDSASSTAAGAARPSSSAESLEATSTSLRAVAERRATSTSRSSRLTRMALPPRTTARSGAASSPGAARG